MVRFIIAAVSALFITQTASAQFTGGVYVAAGDVNGDAATLDTDGKLGAKTMRTAAAGKADEIEILSWSWGETQSGTFNKPQGDGPGWVRMTLKRGFSGRAGLRELYESGGEIPEITLTTEEGGQYLKYKLERCFIKSWSTSGDADDRPTEEVAFYYNKIAFNYARTTDGKRSN
jgi:type VI secretion system secreted protein Hcp